MPSFATFVFALCHWPGARWVLLRSFQGSELFPDLLHHLIQLLELIFQLLYVLLPAVL
jgi:hypothetical protein